MSVWQAQVCEFNCLYQKTKQKQNTQKTNNQTKNNKYKSIYVVSLAWPHRINEREGLAGYPKSNQAVCHLLLCSHLGAVKTILDCSLQHYLNFYHIFPQSKFLNVNHHQAIKLMLYMQGFTFFSLENYAATSIPNRSNLSHSGSIYKRADQK